MVKRVLQRQAFGWYLRVRHDGWLEQGMVFQLQDRPYPQWTVKEVERIIRRRAHEPEAARRLAGSTGGTRSGHRCRMSARVCPQEITMFRRVGLTGASSGRQGDYYPSIPHGY